MDLPPEVVRQACAQRVAEHARAQRERGLVRCTTWVPAAARERLALYAAELRAEAGVLLPSDPVSAKPAKAQPKQPNKPKKKPEAQAAASKPKPSKRQEKPPKKRSPSKERRRQRRKAERAARST